MSVLAEVLERRDEGAQEGVVVSLSLLDDSQGKQVLFLHSHIGRQLVQHSADNEQVGKFTVIDGNGVEENGAREHQLRLFELALLPKQEVLDGGVDVANLPAGGQLVHWLEVLFLPLEQRLFLPLVRQNDRDEVPDVEQHLLLQSDELFAAGADLDF